MSDSRNFIHTFIDFYTFIDLAQLDIVWAVTNSREPLKTSPGSLHTPVDVLDLLASKHLGGQEKAQIVTNPKQTAKNRFISHIPKCSPIGFCLGVQDLLASIQVAKNRLWYVVTFLDPKQVCLMCKTC